MQRYIQQEIERVRNKVLDIAMILFSVVGILSHSFTFVQSLRIGFATSFYIQSVALVALLLAVTFRKKITLITKFSVFSVIAFITIAGGMYSYGILASSTIFIVAFSVFSSFILSLRKALIIMVSMVIMFLFIGSLFAYGVLEYAVDLDEYLSKPLLWLIERSIDIVLTSSGVLLIGYFFTKVLVENYQQISEQKEKLQKHKKKLERLVQKRTSELITANSELKRKNKQIEKQNEELKTTLSNLQNAQAQLIESEKMASLGVLTAGVAHEINNPLNFIMGGYTGLMDYLEDHELGDKEDVKCLLDSIKTGVDRSVEIVKGLNQFSRTGDDLLEECDLHHIIDNCLVILNNQIKYKAILVKDYTDRELVIKGNSGKLHQVFTNLITNALHAIEEKGTITIKTKWLEEEIIVSIEDTGMGIKEEDMPQIIQPFFTTKPPGVGTGLGLSISNSIIQAHHGQLSFESTEGRGTTVRIKFKPVPVASAN